MLVILKITDSFVKKCYFPMMNSLKNEFRRGNIQASLTNIEMATYVFPLIYREWKTSSS